MTQHTGIIAAAATAVTAAVITAFGWMFGRQVKRIDMLEESEFVSKNHFDETIESMRTTIANGDKGTHKRLDKLLLALSQGKVRD